jgi:hypothetical protein
VHASNVALILGPLLPGKRSELGPNIYYEGLGPIVSVDRLLANLLISPRQRNRFGKIGRRHGIQYKKEAKRVGEGVAMHEWRQ